MLLKNDLAQRYFPFVEAVSARKQLLRLIRHNRQLLDELTQAGFKPQSRRIYFTPKEQEIIEKHLGPPP